MTLKLNKKLFEYDIYSLIRAFYPGAAIQIWYEGTQKPEGAFDYSYEVSYEEDLVSFDIYRQGELVSHKLSRVSTDEPRQEYKNHVKRLVYRSLVKQTGQELPWGNLTGIRPTKIPMQLLEDGKTNVEAAQYMRDTYSVSPEKTALAITIANRERYILQNIDYEHGYSLYVGIPFCPSICLYCSFGSHVLKQWAHMVEAYLDALCKELTFISEQMKDWTLDTIYIGGGTPTTLEPPQLERLLSHIQTHFPLQRVLEFTVEAGRPDTITPEKLEVLKRFPVTRISINPQTMNQKTLDLIGRKHLVEDVVEQFHLARSMGFDNINMDLIVGLPGEHAQEVAHTLEEMQALRPDSLTIHSLALKRATRLNLFKDQYEEISFENSQEIMKMTEDCARNMQMGPYYLYRQKNMAGNFENVGYSTAGKEGIYNILIMEEKQTILAAGAGASTKFVFDHGKRIERVENVKDLKNYVERIDEMLERKREGIEKYL
ncbi:MAG: coproporphyrinogen dehydrogenase HemZ [Lachnospiraceae bacterium]|nr:coproporphyrinogen dehydrogenase HemZ [Lachnospiraceae bacterium]